MPDATSSGVRPADPLLERVICPDCREWVQRYNHHAGCTTECDADRRRFLFDYDRATGRRTGLHPCSTKEG